MDASTRRTRFEERVRLERLFLSPVNSVFGDSAPLAGMTEMAISNWLGRASGVSRHLNCHSIASILLEASRRAELLADNSREVFSKSERSQPDGLAQLHQLLVRELFGNVSQSVS